MALPNVKNLWMFIEKNRGLFVDVNQKLTCAICTHILINTHISKCGCQYCEKCYKEHFQINSSVCPGKNEECPSITYLNAEIMINHHTNKKIKDFKIQCPDCSYYDSAINVAEHHIDKHNSEGCPFSEIGCEYDAATSNDLKNHINTNITNHLNLLLMGNSILKNDLIELRNENRMLKTTVNKMLEDIIQIKNYQTKDDDSTNYLLEEMRELYKKYKTNDDENKRIRQNINTYVTNVESKFNKINDKITLMSSYGRYVWEIKDLPSKRNDALNGKDKKILSEYVYSHHFGYKFKFYLYPVSYDVNKSNYMSVGFIIFQSEKDNLLKWPCRKWITMSIVNQQTGEDVIKYSYHYDRTRKQCQHSFNKPTKKSNTGYGTSNFVEWDYLNDSSNSMMIDGTIYIQCIIQD